MKLMMDRLRELIIARENPVSVSHSARTAAVVVVSYLAAYLIRLPEAYWAAITTLIVVQSPKTAYVYFRAVLCWDGSGRRSGRMGGLLFPGQRARFRRVRSFDWNLLHTVPAGPQRVPVRQHYVGNCNACAIA
jgi:hypothetical protein